MNEAEMAAAGGEPSAQSGPDDLFNHFYTEVKQIEKRDSVLTSKQQIVRLLRPGSSYFNLNPFEMKEKKKQLKKDGKPQFVEEDDPEMFRQAVYKQTMKLFAELEIKRKERDAKDMHERKRAREEEIETAEKAKREREWQKNFEVC
ncbi:unnamed protein product [Coregonus sp. 'balchen']|nr:unnamed protein product [Coregonus sp. 'balchen']